MDDAQEQFSEGRIIAISKELAPGINTAEICRRRGISQPTLYSWRSKCGGLEVSEPNLLSVLDEQNRKLNKLLAEQVSDNATLKDRILFLKEQRLPPPKDGLLCLEVLPRCN